MGATFDAKLLNQVGRLIGAEGRRKGVHLALAPTVCIQRSPLLGRGFEAFGEDPILSGTIAANYINGLQDQKVGACIKHYRAHGQSAKGFEDDVHMSQRTLREIHLMPFQVAFANSKPWAVMTAYQKINGIHVSEDPFLMQRVLRDEWGFDGLIVSDWWGTYSTSEAINAGLDLEMPGPSIFRGKQLITAVDARKVSRRTIDESVRRLLRLVQITQPPPLPNAGYGGDNGESRALIRKVAADSIVLLKNSNNILPLPKKGKTVGLIGELFEYPATCGGGSSETMPFYISKPLEAIIEVIGEENVRYEPGCNCNTTPETKCAVLVADSEPLARRWVPLIEDGLTLPGSNEPGLLLEWFGQDPGQIKDAECLHSTTTTRSQMYFSQMSFKNVPDHHFIRIRSTYKASKSSLYRFALSVCGKARLEIDGQPAIDLWTDHPPKSDDTPCFNKLSMERFAELSVEQGKEYDLVITMTNETFKSPVGGYASWWRASWWPTSQG